MPRTRCTYPTTQAAMISDVDLLRRVFGGLIPGKASGRGRRDEGEAFLRLGDESDDMSDRSGPLHPGLDEAFKHVEMLEANMRKGSR